MPTALIVDDEALARTLMIDQLRAYPDIEVIGSAGGMAEAAAFVERTVPDPAFLDLNMPGRFGLELIAKLAATTRVIIVTASEAHALAAFAAGASDCLVKPVDPARLEAALDRIALFTPRDKAEGQRPPGPTSTIPRSRHPPRRVSGTDRNDRSGRHSLDRSRAKLHAGSLPAARQEIPVPPNADRLGGDAAPATTSHASAVR